MAGFIVRYCCEEIILSGRDDAGGYMSDPSGVLDRSFFLVLSCLTFSAARSHIELLTTINGARHLSELIPFDSNVGTLVPYRVNTNTPTIT